jgi:hypothetical protein
MPRWKRIRQTRFCYPTHSEHPDLLRPVGQIGVGSARPVGRDDAAQATAYLSQSCKAIEGALYACSRLPWFVCVPQLAIERRTCFPFRVEI